MLYIIGLGLNADGISKYGLEIVKRCKRVYLENYTVDFPYTKEELAHVIEKKLLDAGREKVESLELVDEAQKMDVALLVYGSPLTATTHISLIEEAKRLGIRYKVICNASILDAVAETGLQLYKFGKTASMPKWDEKKNFTPDSFMKIVQENQSMKAHSLILTDIGLSFPKALEQLEKSAKIHKISLKKIVVCQRLGTKNRKIIYKDVGELREYDGVKSPYCIVIPSKLHFVEKEVLEGR
ncbi:diphthine synthase [archaeon BMS3Abin17]|nr:diphthine synthase [archaeon BMS3Abin17]HDZ61041.1 diphthine synthase [Candidatus Pacearchaeota archaeon]